MVVGAVSYNVSFSSVAFVITEVTDQVVEYIEAIAVCVTVDSPYLSASSCE